VGNRAAMEKEQVSQGQADPGAPAGDDSTIDLETMYEIKERAQSLIELSRELTSSSKALLEKIEPSA